MLVLEPIFERGTPSIRPLWIGVHQLAAQRVCI
jgi:hypothetical protein